MIKILVKILVKNLWHKIDWKFRKTGFFKKRRVFNDYELPKKKKRKKKEINQIQVRRRGTISKYCVQLLQNIFIAVMDLKTPTFWI